MRRPSGSPVPNTRRAIVSLISEAYRRRIFGNASGIGEVIKLDAVPATVIGVAADGFGGLQADGRFDIIVPFAVMRAAVGGDPSTPLRSKQVVSRLAPGVSLESARAELLGLRGDGIGMIGRAPRELHLRHDDA
jgi:hypothetical protein